MLGIILFILKVLGILLLVILGLILLLLLLVFFAPIKYSGEGSKYGNELKLRALVTYLNPVMRVIVQYPDVHVVEVKICGFTVFSTGESDETKEEHIGEETYRAESETKEKETYSFEDHKIIKQKCEYQGKQENNKAKEESDSQPGSSAEYGEQTVPKNNNTAEAKKHSPEPKQEQYTPHDMENGTTEVGAKNSTIDTVGYYASLFQENKGLILNVLKTIVKALKTLLPKKCCIKAVFGTGEADKTGFIYAAYCALESYLPGEIVFEPVWTEKFAEGEFVLKGKIQLIHFLVAAIKIIANKNVRLLIKKIRRI